MQIMDASLWPRTLKDVLKQIQNILQAHNIRDYKIESFILIEERTTYSHIDVISSPDLLICDDHLGRILDDLRLRISGKPLYRIYGRREFWGMSFRIGDETLEPRADTEVLVEKVLSSYSQTDPPRYILDLGTGSGCILLALLKEFPNAFGIGVDLSFNTLVYAQENAIQHKLNDRAMFICSHWLDSFLGGFDLIVSNPPYIPSRDIFNLDIEVKDHDPILALDGGSNGLKAYQNIFSAMKRLVSYPEKAFFEIGFDQADDIVRLIEKYGLSKTYIHADYAGRARVVEISCGDK